MSCLNFAAAAFPSTIKHQVVPSMGPAVMAWRKLAGIKNRTACNLLLDSRDKFRSFANAGDSLAASSKVNGVLRRFINEKFKGALKCI